MHAIGDTLFTYEVPVSWIMTGTIRVQAANEQFAARLAYHQPYPVGEPIPASMHVDNQAIRQID